MVIKRGKMMQSTIDFYSEYLKKTDLQTDDADLYKTNYLKQMLEEGKYIYKFYGFDNNIELNESKYETFIHDKIWVSPYFCFKDTTEFDIKYNVKSVSEQTGNSVKDIKDLINCIMQIDDLASFTTSISDRMWRDYACNYNGFCVKYEIQKFDKFYPIIYTDKSKIDYTDTIISTFKILKEMKGLSIFKSIEFKKLSILPCVLKEKTYSNENEIRCLTDMDFRTKGSSCLQGKLSPFCKVNNGYYGSAETLEYLGLTVNQVMVSLSCSYREKILLACKEKEYNAKIITTPQ